MTNRLYSALDEDWGSGQNRKKARTPIVPDDNEVPASWHRQFN